MWAAIRHSEQRIRAMMERNQALEEVARLRNRHVAKLLSHLGNDVAPYLAIAIKKALSMFAEDVCRNIIDEEQSEQGEQFKGGL